MSKISVLRNNFEGTGWKRSFASKLTALVPDMNPDAADEVSDAEFVHYKDTDPAVAAQLWLQRQERPDASDASTPAASAG